MPPNVLEQLIEGNRRFASNASTHPNRCNESRQKVIKEQNPFAVIVSCSDSRVPAEILFDCGVGDLFIVRVAGNVVGPLENASISLAVNQLGVSLIFVLGHENCEAVDAVLSGKGDLIKPIASHIQPAVEGVSDLKTAVCSNVLHVCGQLKKEYPPPKVLVQGGYYSLQTGQVESLRVSP